MHNRLFTDVTHLTLAKWHFSVDTFLSCVAFSASLFTLPYLPPLLMLPSSLRPLSPPRAPLLPLSLSSPPFQLFLILSNPPPPPHLAGGGVSRQRGAEEGRELPHTSEKRSLFLRARPGLAPRGDASFAVWVGPAGQGGQAEGWEASVQDADRLQAAS